MRQTRTPVLSFEVEGPPPVRTEGLSMLAAGHRQAERVRALLQAAAAAAQRIGWHALTGSVALEVSHRCPPGRRTAEAATLLGGIAAVLQDRKRAANIGLAHLGVLADVAIYADERQIRQLSYREMPAAQASYSVRISAIPTVV